MLNVAVPLTPSVAVPKMFLPSKKTTVPAVAAEPGTTLVIVAVNVTDWPKNEGLAELTTLADKVTCLTA